MRWFSWGKIEIGVSRGRLFVGVTGRRISRRLIDWSW